MPINAAFTDLLTDRLYLSSGTEIRAALVGASIEGTWRSKVIVRDDHPGFGWLRVNGDDLTAGVVVTVYGDGALYFTSASLTSRTPVRMPPGRFREWEIEVISTARITSVVLATSADELEDA